MRGIVIASVSALFMGAATAGAQESSVYVNLSALDALNTETVAEPATPLFPVIKPQSPKTASAQKARPAKAKKKTASKPVSKVEVKVVETVKPQPVKEDKPAPIPYVESADEVIVVDVEPVTADNVAAPAEKTVASGTADETKTADEVAKDEKTLVAEPVSVTMAQPAPITPEVSSRSESGASESLLVNPQDTQPSTISAKIIFADGENELTDSHKTQIDGIINGFADAANNKIAIYSYNLDDGVDSFRKKRLSLNRAVEVRSYLLQKGYKNFSIKVLNVDASSDKTNSVELEELK